MIIETIKRLSIDMFIAIALSLLIGTFCKKSQKTWGKKKKKKKKKKLTFKI